MDRFLLPSRDIAESGGLVLMLRLDIDGDLEDDDVFVSVPMARLFGDRDLPGLGDEVVNRGLFEPGPSKLFGFSL